MQILCPQCGALVRFESAAAVMVVCGSCRSTLMREGEAARRVGHMAELIDEASPVQLGTTGRDGQRRFRVLGRLRLQYDAGAWNEWYIVFDDGTHGWLSDASVQYFITRRKDDADVTMLPGFEELRAGLAVKVDGTLYTVSDVRRARCVGGEGELPIQAGDGWGARVVDARRATSFITLDYSESQPAVYVGATGKLQLDKDTLRRVPDQGGAVRTRGAIAPLDCPNCAGTVSIAVAMATQVVCPSCGSVLDCGGERAEVIEASRRLARFKTTIPLGATGRIGTAEYTVMGAMRCDVPEDGSEPAWTEYLLLNPESGYLWLVETQGGWQRVTVCDEWPSVTDDAMARWGKRTWIRRYTYTSRVTQVFGAFNWRVRRGDVSRVTDFASNADMLTREQSDDEVTWSNAVSIGGVTVARAFGLPMPPARVAVETDRGEGDALIGIAIIATMLLFIVADSITGMALFLGIALVWLPLLLTGQLWSAMEAVQEDS